MKKRLFVAIKLPESFIKAFEQYLKKINIQGIKTTPTRNLHLTVYFLGSFQEKFIPQVKTNLGEIFLKTKPFKIIFEKIIFAPPGKTPRMIWAQFQSSDFKALATAIGKKFDEFLKPRHKIKEREILPHVTLARFKSAKIAKNAKLKEIKLKEKEFEVKSCQLLESTLRKSGPIYSLIKDFHFAQ